MVRKNTGYVSGKLRTNAIFAGCGKKSFSSVPTIPIDGEMSGEGFRDVIKGIYNQGKNLAGIYTSEFGTAIRNAIPDSDNTARPGFAGEKHAILQLPNGKYGVANYMGPSTNLIKRLERNDPPRTETDRASQAHDIRYGLAQNIGDVRNADKIMMNAVDRIARNKTDSQKNILQARLIKAKMGLEDMGILKRDAFSGDLSTKNINSNEKILLNGKLQTLEQAGYGKKLLPGDALKMKLLKQMAGKGKTGVSSSRDLGEPYKMSGSGGILDFVVSNIIPKLMKMVGIKEGTVSQSQLKNIISKSMSMIKNGNLSTITEHLSKTILPILTALKSKSMGGNGIVGYGKVKAKLISSLNKGLTKSFKNYLKGKGLGLAGSGFWGDFKKGFLSVFKPGAKILGGVASALGQPEIGIPLEILSSAL